MVDLEMKRLLIALGAAAAVLVGAYMVRFAQAAHWQPSQNTEDWARLGEYVGGVFGVLAFIGVLITIELQRKQLDQLSEQLRQATNKGTVDELMQLCRVLAKNIDDRLDQPLPTVVHLAERNFVRLAHESEDIRGLTKAIAIPGLQRELSDITDKSADPQVLRALQRIAREMDPLAHCVEDMCKWGGSLVILNFYRERHRDAAQAMVKFDVLLDTAPFWLQQNEEVHPR
jgi:hypothetical protein